MNQDIYGYVRYCFQKNFPEYYLIFGEDGIKYPGRKFVETIESKINGNYSSQDIKRGLFDDEINKELNDYLDGYFTKQQRKDCDELYRYIYNLLTENGVKADFSDDIFDHVVKKVMARVWPQYDKNRLNTEKFNHLINLFYEDVARKLFDSVNKKITQLIYTKDDIFNFITYNINEVELRKFIVDSIFANEDRLFLEKLNLTMINNKNSLSQTGKKIYKYVNQYVSENAQKRVDTVEYITDYLEKTYGIGHDKEFISEAAVSINKTLKQRDGLRDEEIASPECHVLIGRYFARYVMKSNSVKTDGQPEKIEKNGKKRVMSDKLIALLLIASLVGAATLFGLGMDKYTRNRDARNEVELFDSHSYLAISSVYDPDLEPTAKNVINTYSKYSQFNNDNYKFLGFYRAFISIDSETYKSVIAETSVSSREEKYDIVIDKRLFIMDNMFSLIKSTISNDPNYASLKNELKGDYCFINFMYDRLEDMGFEKIRDDKYTEALEAYIEAKMEHPYKNPLNYMNNKERKALEDASEKYIKYNEQYMIELGVLLGEQKNVETEGLSNSDGGYSK